MSVLTIWCSSLLEDARAILSLYNLHLAVCTSFLENIAERGYLRELCKAWNFT